MTIPYINLLYIDLIICLVVLLSLIKEKDKGKGVSTWSPDGAVQIQALGGEVAKLVMLHSIWRRGKYADSRSPLLIPE